MFSHPKNNILHTQLAPGMVVADMGVGSGEYARSAAALVGATGTVYALDIQKELLVRLENEKISNIHSIWGDIEVKGGTRLRDGSVDVCLLTNTLFQLEKKEQALTEIARILKKGGKLMLIDWTDSFSGMGPQPQYIVSQKEAERLCTAVGLVLEKTFDAGDHHYGFIASKLLY